MGIFDKDLIRFLLLSGYSQEKVGLMYGKTGIAVSLFEVSCLLEDDSVEEYATDLLQEVLATPITNNSFDNGKAGVAWALLYLINNRYIDADYVDIYIQEHNSIIAYIKNAEFATSNPLQCIDYLFFLLMAESFITLEEFKEVWDKLLNIMLKSYIEKNEMSYDSFYLNSAKIIGLYNVYENKRFLLEPLVKIVMQKCKELQENCCVCHRLAFGVELLTFGMNCTNVDIISLASSVVDVFFSNLLVKTLDYKSAVDILYNIERLSLLRRVEEYPLIAQQLRVLLYDKKSFLYSMDRQTLAGLKGGVPRFIWNESVDNSLSAKHIIMLQ